MNTGHRCVPTLGCKEEPEGGGAAEMKGSLILHAQE